METLNPNNPEKEGETTITVSPQEREMLLHALDFWVYSEEQAAPHELAENLARRLGWSPDDDRFSF